MLGMEKRLHVLYGDEVGQKADDPKTMEHETKSSAKAGLALGLLAILLAVVVYLALDAKIGAVQQSIDAAAAIESRMALVEAKMAAVDTLPLRMRKMFMADRLIEMSQTAARIAPGLETDAQRALLAKIDEMTRQLQSDIAK